MSTINFPSDLTQLQKDLAQAAATATNYSVDRDTLAQIAALVGLTDLDPRRNAQFLLHRLDKTQINQIATIGQTGLAIPNAKHPLTDREAPTYGLLSTNRLANNPQTNAVDWEKLNNDPDYHVIAALPQHFDGLLLGRILPDAHYQKSCLLDELEIDHLPAAFILATQPDPTAPETYHLNPQFYAFNDHSRAQATQYLKDLAHRNPKLNQHLVNLVTDPFGADAVTFAYAQTYLTDTKHPHHAPRAYILDACQQIKQSLQTTDNSLQTAPRSL